MEEISLQANAKKPMYHTRESFRYATPGKNKTNKITELSNRKQSNKSQSVTGNPKVGKAAAKAE